eukprot:jgi/Bigna1/75163/fgenesh1_pg.33_\
MRSAGLEDGMEHTDLELDDLVMDPEWEEYRFAGTEQLFGSEALRHFKAAHVCVIGIGGVGSWAVEALARSGVGKLTLVDMDDVCITNMNRQLHALQPLIGRQKIDVMAERMRQINPNIEIEIVSEYFMNSTAERILGTLNGLAAPAEKSRYSVIIDTIGDAKYKADLIYHASSRNVPVISVGSVSGRNDTTQIAKGPLSLATNDPLLDAVKNRLRDTYGYEIGEDSANGALSARCVTCVYSREPHPSTTDGGFRMDYGTATHLTGAFGFVASYLSLSCIAAEVEPSATT